MPVSTVHNWIESYFFNTEMQKAWRMKTVISYKPFSKRVIVRVIAKGRDDLL